LAGATALVSARATGVFTEAPTVLGHRTPVPDVPGGRPGVDDRPVPTLDGYDDLLQARA
jgi:hypothetical protein